MHMAKFLLPAEEEQVDFDCLVLLDLGWMGKLLPQ